MLKLSNIIFRKQDLDEIRLKNILPEISLQRRRKVNSVNMKTMLICWLVEFAGSALLIFGPFITGHRNVGWGVIQVLILFVYFILVPLTYLINSSDTKKAITDFDWSSGVSVVFRHIIGGLAKRVRTEKNSIYPINE